MEFIRGNLIDTYTSLTITGGGTATLSDIISSDLTRQYLTDGSASDSISAQVTMIFSTTTNVSRIAIQEHNLKQFRLFYNSVTANSLALASGSGTTTANFANQTDTSHYLVFTTIACSSLTLEMDRTLVANDEKAIGRYTISDLVLDFATNGRIPAAKDYKPNKKQESVTHTLSDGGTRNHKVDKKWQVKIKYKYISETFRDELEVIYERTQPYIFCPFGTTLAWDGILFECVWPGNFEFYEYSDDASGAGYSGNIDLRET